MELGLRVLPCVLCNLNSIRLALFLFLSSIFPMSRSKKSKKSKEKKESEEKNENASVEQKSVEKNENQPKSNITEDNTVKSSETTPVFKKPFYKPVAPEAKVDLSFALYYPKSIREEYKAATIIPYTIVDGSALILLGLEQRKNKNNGWFWSPCGGKREAGETIEETCVREFSEETNGIFDSYLKEIKQNLQKEVTYKFYNASGRECFVFTPIKFDPKLPASFKKSIDDDTSTPEEKDNAQILLDRTGKRQLMWVDALKLVDAPEKVQSCLGELYDMTLYPYFVSSLKIPSVSLLLSILHTTPSIAELMGTIELHSDFNSAMIVLVSEETKINKMMTSAYVGFGSQTQFRAMASVLGTHLNYDENGNVKTYSKVKKTEEQTKEKEDTDEKETAKEKSTKEEEEKEKPKKSSGEKIVKENGTEKKENDKSKKTDAPEQSEIKEKTPKKTTKKTLKKVEEKKKKADKKDTKKDGKEQPIEEKPKQSDKKRKDKQTTEDSEENKPKTTKKQKKEVEEKNADEEGEKEKAKDKKGEEEKIEEEKPDEEKEKNEQKEKEKKPKITKRKSPGTTSTETKKKKSKN